MPNKSFNKNIAYYLAGSKIMRIFSCTAQPINIPLIMKEITALNYGGLFRFLDNLLENFVKNPSSECRGLPCRMTDRQT